MTTPSPLPHPAAACSACRLWHCLLLAVAMCLTSCARMGQPDGGWYDQLPPRVMGSMPADGATGVSNRRIIINFDEYIKLENPQQNVVVSPAQHEPPTIRVQGRHIVVDLNDSLKANTTYTIDFSDAITDLNEGNPMGNYTYTFSTGTSIDSMQVSGHVVDALTLAPVQGILVGVVTADDGGALESAEARASETGHVSLQRVARTDAQGHFTVKGVAHGRYRVMALADIDADFSYSLPSEQVAFDDSIYVPSLSAANRQDTLWRDSLHIRDIRRTAYTHYRPDDIVLRAFTATPTQRHLLKVTRTDADRLSILFTAPDTEQPRVSGLNFDDTNAFVVEASQHNDTLTYWLRDSTLIKQDTLRLSLTYRATDDSLDVLLTRSDTLDVVARRSYELRQKDRAREYARWQQQQQRRKQRGESTESMMPADMLQPKYNILPIMPPDYGIPIQMPTPLARIDTAAIHLYATQDSTWHPIDKRFIETGHRQYELRAAWQHNTSYSLEIDSAAFVDIYGRVNTAYKVGLKVPDASEYGSLVVTLDGWAGQHVVAQLLNKQGSVVKTATTDDGTLPFFYLRAGTYYLRAFIDADGDGQWSTGDYHRRQQPELLCYYPRGINVRANWDIRERWNPTAVPAHKQKPRDMGAGTAAGNNMNNTQQREEKKSVALRNRDRARRLGIKEIPPKVLGAETEQ